MVQPGSNNHERIFAARRIFWFMAAITIAASIGMIVNWRAPGLSLQAQDGLMRLRGSIPVSQDIVIVAIDEKSLARFGRFPWPRLVMAQAMDQIAAAGPRAVALNVLYTDPTEPEADQSLAEAIGRVGRVVVAAQLIQARDDDGLPGSAWLEPLPSIEAAAGATGHVNISTGADGVARTLLLRQTDNQAHDHWAMAVELLRLADGVQTSELRELPDNIGLGGKRIPVSYEAAPVVIEPAGDRNAIEMVRASSMAINYAGPTGTFSPQTVSIVDLIDGKVPAGRLRGKLILIGATANALGDRLASPFTRLESEDGDQHATLMPGVEILANAVQTIEGNRYIQITPDWLSVIFSLLVAAGAVLSLGIAQGRGEWPASVIAMVLLAALLLSVTLLVFVRFSIVLPIVPMFVAFVTAAPLTLLHRSRLAGAELDSRIVELTSHDRALGLPSPARDDSPAPMIAHLTNASSVCLLQREKEAGRQGSYRIMARHGFPPAAAAEAKGGPVLRMTHPPYGSVSEALVRDDAAERYFATFGETRHRAVTISTGEYGDNQGALVIAYPSDQPPAPETLQVCREMASSWLASSPRNSRDVSFWSRLSRIGGPRGIQWKIRTLGTLQRLLLRRTGFINRAMRSIEDGLLIAGVDGQVSFANPRAGQIFSIPQHTLIGRNLFHLIFENALLEDRDPQRGRERLNGVLTRLFIDRAPYERELVITSDGGHGEDRHYMLRLGIVCEDDNGQGPVTGIVATLSDVTRQHELQQMKNDVLALVTHELRTPITAIQGMSEILSQHEYNADERHEMHQAINEESKRLSRLIDEYLDLTRLESGARTLRRTAVRLTPLLERTLLLLEPIARQREIRLIRRFALNLPPVLADADLLMQAANNLVTNAIKYSPASRDVTIETGMLDEEVWICVSDQGHGIPEQELSQIFEKFYRISRLEDADVTGTGLGLPLVREVMQLHGGRVTVESEVGVGSKFTMFFRVQSIK